MIMIVNKNPITDIFAYLTNHEIANIGKINLETTIFESGRKRMSNKTLRIILNEKDDIDHYALKKKDEKTTLYICPLSNWEYLYFKENGTFFKDVQAKSADKKNRRIYLKNIEAFGPAELKQYQNLEKSIGDYMAKKRAEEITKNVSGALPILNGCALY